MTQLNEIRVTLSENQKKNLSSAFHKRETIVLRLSRENLTGRDTLFVPLTTVKRLENSRSLNKGIDIKLSKTNIRKQVGGSLLTAIMSLAPTLAKTVGLSALGGLASEGASQLVKKISGKGVQSGGFLIPNSKIEQLIAHKHLLSDKQKRDILNALQTGSGVSIRPTKKQTGGLLGTLLASIGVPLAIEVVKKLTGKGAPGFGAPPPPPSPTPYRGKGAPQLGIYKPPWIGGGKKKGKGLILGKDSPFNGIPIVGAIL